MKIIRQFIILPKALAVITEETKRAGWWFSNTTIRKALHEQRPIVIRNWPDINIYEDNQKH